MSSAQVQPASAVDEVKPHATTGHGVSARLHCVLTPSLAVQGKYSIERLLALEEYSRTKSYWHVLWVVVWTPLVPILMILAYQLPPLAPPEAGLRANWMYLVERGGLGAYAAFAGVLVITCGLIPELDPVLPHRTRTVISSIVAGVYVYLTVTLAHWWSFPVPFSVSIINPTTGLLGMSCLYLVVRPTRNQSSQLPRRFKMIIIYATVFSCASLVYPAYIALFIFVGDHSPNYQPFVTLLALLTKFVLRKIVAYAVREWEDLIHVMAIFSVEFFSSMYQVVSIQASISFLTTTFIIACDFVFTARSLWKLYKRTESLQLLLQDSEADVLLPALADL